MSPDIEPIPTLINMRHRYTALPTSFAAFFTETVTERIGRVKQLERDLPSIPTALPQSLSSAQRQIDHEPS